MPRSSAGPPDPAIPFVLGVTGKLAFGGYDDAVSDPAALSPVAADLRRRVWALLDWLRAPARSGALDPATALFEPEKDPAEDWWRPFGLGTTPIVVLSSLAPGVDTLVAEAVLDYAAEREAPVSVRAPLPLPPSLYPECSSFRPERDPASWGAKGARLTELLGRLARQPGFVAERDLFCVELDDDLEGDRAADLQDRERLNLRYRAAGEYVATYSHLLVAVYDERDEPRVGLEELSDLRAPGTIRIVAAKRRGLSYELLSLANSFAWADHGPVLHVPIDQVSDGTTPCARPLALLHPYDCRPGTARSSPGPRRALETLLPGTTGLRSAGPPPESDADPEWQRVGDLLLRERVKNLLRFNELPRHREEDRGLAALLRCHEDDPKTWIGLDAEGQAFADGLADLAALRLRASASAQTREAARRTLLRRLAWLILLAAAALGLSESGPRPGIAPGQGWLVTEAVAAWPALCLLGAVAFLATSGFLYWRHLRSGAEAQRFDHRAIGAGLRVQFYWCLAGIQASAAAEYLQRHRSELSWIRDAIASAAIPLERWKDGFERLRPQSRVRILQAVHLAWVRGQMFYARARAGSNERKARLWHHWGWTLSAAGLLGIAGHLLAAASPALGAWIEEHMVLVAGGAVALGGLGLLLGAARGFGLRGHETGAHGPSPELPFHTWVLARPVLWGWASVLAGGGLAFAHLVPSLTRLGPDAEGWWTVLTGVSLVAGALSLAWNERNFHGEHSRQYRALHGLCTSADRRLEGLIALFARLPSGSPQAERTLEEIRSILFQLGREALAENAEWLIQHRVRPLEPFLAS